MASVPYIRATTFSWQMLWLNIRQSNATSHRRAEERENEPNKRKSLEIKNKTLYMSGQLVILWQRISLAQNSLRNWLYMQITDECVSICSHSIIHEFWVHSRVLLGRCHHHKCFMTLQPELRWRIDWLFCGFIKKKNVSECAITSFRHNRESSILFRSAWLLLVLYCFTNL